MKLDILVISYEALGEYKDLLGFTEESWTDIQMCYMTASVLK